MQNTLYRLISGISAESPLPPRPSRTKITASVLRTFIAPLLLIVFTPLIVVGVWILISRYEGSLSLFAGLFSNGMGFEWVRYIPHPSWKAAAIIAAWVVFQWMLLVILPGKKITGPLTINGNTPHYKQNGVLAWVVTHGVLFGVLYPLGIVNPGVIYQFYGSILITLNLATFVFCILLYIKGRLFPSNSDTVYTGRLIFDFFQGIELYPTYAGVSLKQLINCRVSMMGWSVVSISFLIAQYDAYGFVSSGMFVSTFILVMYLFKFFVWERGYFYSLDIMHDRFGYYMCWGILVWVPSVYCIVGLYLVEHPVNLGLIKTVLLIGLGLLSIGINYSSDNQRRRVRDSGGQTTVWGKSPRLIQAQYTSTDGHSHSNVLLASGWWGVARHFNYVPELMLAAAWTIPAGFTNIVPWMYWIFLLILLVDRTSRDEKRCAKKYGSYWDEYKKLVPYKMIPGIF